MNWSDGTNDQALPPGVNTLTCQMQDFNFHDSLHNREFDSDSHEKWLRLVRLMAQISHSKSSSFFWARREKTAMNFWIHAKWIIHQNGVHVVQGVVSSSWPFFFFFFDLTNSASRLYWSVSADVCQSPFSSPHKRQTAPLSASKPHSNVYQGTSPGYF